MRLEHLLSEEKLRKDVFKVIKLEHLLSEEKLRKDVFKVIKLEHLLSGEGCFWCSSAAGQANQ